MSREVLKAITFRVSRLDIIFSRTFFFLVATTEWNNLETNSRNLSSCKAAGTDMIYLTRGKSRDGRKKNFGLI